MTVQTSNTGIAIENGSFIGSYSNYAFAAILYNNQRVDRKAFDKLKKYMLTADYAARLVAENKDLFINE